MLNMLCAYKNNTFRNKKIMDYCKFSTYQSIKKITDNYQVQKYADFKKKNQITPFIFFLSLSPFIFLTLLKRVK